MFRLEKEIRFEAAHRLPDHDGKCARLHGHSWRAAAILEASEPAEEPIQDDGPQRGMVYDFARISEPLKHLRDNYLDHYHLNESLPVYPTSERIAAWLYQKVVDLAGDDLCDAPVELVGIRVDETCKSTCIYRPYERE